MRCMSLRMLAGEHVRIYPHVFRLRAYPRIGHAYIHVRTSTTETGTVRHIGAYTSICFIYLYIGMHTNIHIHVYLHLHTSRNPFPLY